ncbi:Nif3-like dinuclear metal center hexameric protein [Buchnera aphidicola (Nipponaphis monzeni)]|uniref:Nif3-like dinuclear metal center hexameric protein n=1 Tax=Buchnera aphidicola (Nipponaphis monzeni) TaxID=2495405 RepID=A0A455TAB5_9GAMM|nr:Nif3-like dinuclear metal center hexameric protein [Buchnera aphidicola]BBI01245.1 Nif3-like dinuclear metal center hexameric protein [Buchnera aphidicola (Nipponaphis monzeni)]
MNNQELENIINKELSSSKYQDSCPNGLQVEGQFQIKKIITGVTACQKFLNVAVKCKADTVIVHHGFFWKNDPLVIKGLYRKRFKTVLCNDINLYCWHMPLDNHKKLGNNIQIAKKLDISIQGEIIPFLWWGYFKKPISYNALKYKIFTKFNRMPFYYSANKIPIIKKIAWCSGKGQSFIHAAACFGVDAFLTGEISEETIHFIREYKLHFFSAGHHATEKYGVEALGNWLSNEYCLNVKFVNIENPI